MRNLSIIVDTTCDLDIKLMDEKNIIYVPLGVEINGETYKDRVEITTKEFYEKIKTKGVFPRTSLVPPATFEEVFKKELDKGNDILCISLSSKLSGTFSSANMAKDMLESDRVFLLDSKNGSSGIAAIILEAVKLREEGIPVEEIIKKLEHLIQNQKCMIYVEDMEMLKRGGRVPSALALLGGMLKIKPILTVKDGEVIPYSKVRGRKAAFKIIVEELLSEAIDNRYPIMIAHANNLEYAIEMQNALSENFSEFNFIISEMGSAIGTHSGENALAVWLTKI